jgi:hypothetical protein
VTARRVGPGTDGTLHPMPLRREDFASLRGGWAAEMDWLAGGST